MRRHGYIAGVSFVKTGWSIYNLAYEYRLTEGEGSHVVYVNSMAELKQEIRKIVGDYHYEQENQIPMSLLPGESQATS